MEEVRLFDLFNTTDQTDQSAEIDWLQHFRIHDTPSAVHRLVQFFVDLIQGDTSITLPPDINTGDGYNIFFNDESDNLRDYIDFTVNPPSLRSFFAFLISETNNEEEWLANTVDVLHLMSNIESSPTMQVFAGYCCNYVLECLGKMHNNLSIDDIGVNSQAAYVALCSRLCSAIFHVYEICLSSTCYSDLAKYFLVRFISETQKNSTLMCEENIPFYQLAVQVKYASMNVKIVKLMCDVLTSRTSTDDQKEFMLRVGQCMENELSYHITQRKFPNVVRACLKLVVEMHKISNIVFTGFFYDHIYQNLFSRDIEIRRLAAQLFVNKSAIAVPPKSLLKDVIDYHFKYETRSADNWQMLIDAFEQYDNFFDWVTLFQMLDTYSIGEQAKACHVAVAIFNVVTYQIKKWNSEELDEMNVMNNLEPLFKLLASKFNTNLGTFNSKVFSSLLQIFDVVNVAHFMRNARLKTEFTDMLKSFTETFWTSSNYILATRLCQILRRVEVNDPQAINLNALLNKICNNFTLAWENQLDELGICLYPTMRLLVILQHITDIDAINLQELFKILVICRTAFDRIKSADYTTLQAFVVNSYALTFVHLKLKEKQFDGGKMDQYTDDLLNLFECLTSKLNSNHNVNATFWEYMIFSAVCVLVTYISILPIGNDQTELINTLLEFLIKFIKAANDCQSKNQARIMILTLAEAFTNEVPLPYELFIVLNENHYYDEQFNEFIKALLPNKSCNRTLFYRTFATAVHRMAEHKNPNISELVKRFMVIVEDNIPAILEQQVFYTNVMVWVFRKISEYARINASNSSQARKTTYNALPYLSPLFEHVKANPVLASKIRKSLPIPSYAASLDANEINDLKSFYSLIQSI